MHEMHVVTVPAASSAKVRRAAGALDFDELADKGLAGSHVYFAGGNLLIRLQGDADDLVGAFRGTTTGASFLGALEEHAWFSRLERKLRLAARAGPGAPSGGVTAVASYGVNSGHEGPLVRELQRAAASLAVGPAMEFYTGQGLVIHFTADSPDAIERSLREDDGLALQRALYHHTGYDPASWGEELSFDLEAVERGVVSTHNFAPTRPASMDPSDLGRGDIKGTWDHPPPFRVPRHP